MRLRIRGRQVEVGFLILSLASIFLAILTMRIIAFAVNVAFPYY